MKINKFELIHLELFISIFSVLIRINVNKLENIMHNSVKFKFIIKRFRVNNGMDQIHNSSFLPFTMKTRMEQIHTTATATVC